MKFRSKKCVGQLTRLRLECKNGRSIWSTLWTAVAVSGSELLFRDYIELDHMTYTLSSHGCTPGHERTNQHPAVQQAWTANTTADVTSAGNH